MLRRWRTGLDTIKTIASLIFCITRHLGTTDFEAAGESVAKLSHLSVYLTRTQSLELPNRIARVFPSPPLQQFFFMPLD